MVELLRLLGSRCHLAQVEDDAGYYEGGNRHYRKAREIFEWENSPLRVLGEALKKVLDRLRHDGEEMAE